MLFLQLHYSKLGLKNIVQCNSLKIFSICTLQSTFVSYKILKLGHGLVVVHWLSVCCYVTIVRCDSFSCGGQPTQDVFDTKKKVRWNIWGLMGFVQNAYKDAVGGKTNKPKVLP